MLFVLKKESLTSQIPGGYKATYSHDESHLSEPWSVNITSVGLMTDVMTQFSAQTYHLSFHIYRVADMVNNCKSVCRVFGCSMNLLQVPGSSIGLANRRLTRQF
jgi:hypothetical protein